MIRLENTTVKLQALLGGAVSANQLQCVVSFYDDNVSGERTRGSSQQTNTNNTTDVDICNALGTGKEGFIRNIDTLTVYNKDTAAATVTVKKDDGGTETILVKATLATLETLGYDHESGWWVQTASGARKSSTGTLALDDLSDVTITGVASGDGLVYNGSAWVNTGVIKNSLLTTTGDTIYASAANTPARLAIGTAGQVQAVNATATAPIYIDNPSRPNLLINPNWQIDQINEGALYTINATGVQGPDGWSGDAVGAGVFKLRTIADPDNAALKCLEITCTTADASIAASDRYEIWTAVEGYDAAALQFGLASGVPFIYQFKLKSNSVTGVVGVYFSNSAGNRFYAGTITIAGTSEAEYSVTLTPDASGTWLYTNGIGLRMGLVLAAGTDFQGTAGAWSASTVRTTASQCNFMSVNTNIFYLKRGMLMQGSLVQAYKPADIERELAKCQRYYEKTFAQGTAPAQNIGINTGEFQWSVAFGAGAAGILIPFAKYSVAKRTTATIVSYNPAAANAQVRDITAAADCSSFSVLSSNDQGFAASYTNNAGTGVSNRQALHWTANARLS